MEGLKHLVECRCMLPQLRSKGILHKFVVFSELDGDSVKLKFAQCNNCGVIHKVTDICKSTVLSGKEHLSSILTIDDIKTSLVTTSKDIAAALDRLNVDLATWENVKFIIVNKKWNNFVTLSSETEDGLVLLKYIVILGENLFRIDTHTKEMNKI